MAEGFECSGRAEANAPDSPPAGDSLGISDSNSGLNRGIPGVSAKFERASEAAATFENALIDRQCFNQKTKIPASRLSFN